MPSANSGHLKLHRGPADQPVAGPWESLCGDFTAATGCELRYFPPHQCQPEADSLWSAPVDPGVGDAPGYLAIGPAAERSLTGRDPSASRRLAASLAEMMGRIERLSSALGDREAELAAGIPLVARPAETHRFASRLECILRAAADFVGGDAAGMYLLDAATTSLKLRGGWGLPALRLLDPPRPLPEARADLEALSGRAVVLEDPHLHAFWSVPEQCRTAACVPISSPSSVLGTLWVFGDGKLPLGDRETEQLEIIAGRLAAELERELLLNESAGGHDLKCRHRDLEDLLQLQLPGTSPQLANWDVAGWSSQAGGVGGDFHDWFPWGEQGLGVALGDAHERSAVAAMLACSVRAELRCCSRFVPRPAEVLLQASHGLWTGNAGGQYVSAWIVKLDDHDDCLEWAQAGRGGALLHAPDCSRPFDDRTLPLGVQPDPSYKNRRLQLEQGATLILFTQGVADLLLPCGRSFVDGPLAEAVARHSAATPTLLASLLREEVDALVQGGDEDMSLVVIRRKRVGG